MPDLQIPVETAGAFEDINFRAIAEAYDSAVHVVTDLEGTIIPWERKPGGAEPSPAAVSALTAAVDEEVVTGAHAITNRGGKGGRILTKQFVDMATGINDGLHSFGQSPLDRTERKPNGVMAERVYTSIAEVTPSYYCARNTGRIVMVFIGDKLSDLRQAEGLMDRHRKLEVVGILLHRYGNTDHPLDTLFGKRKAANQAWAEIHESSTQNFVHQ